MIKQSNIPQLRFKGFEGEWENSKFGEIATNKSGKFNPAKENNFIKCIELEHLGTENGQLLGFIDGNNSGSIKNLFNEGDVLFGKLRPYLKKYLQAPFEGVCSSEIWVLKGIKITNSFLYQIIQTNKFIDLANQSSGSKMPRADWNVVENGIFPFPTLPEQEKIASFLSAVDEKIQQLILKVALLEQYKKGVMQQLFSGKLRFKDENGEEYADWKWVGGNELFDNISDKKHNSDLPILAITQEKGAIPRDLINYQMTVTDASIASYKVVQIGDFIISLRTFQGGIEFSEYHGICSPAYNILRPSSEEVDKTFYKFYLKTTYYIKQLQKNLEGIRDGKMISYKYFSEIKLPFPCLAEQQKIAGFLSGIDEKIGVVNGELLKMQGFKKGLLQRMFI